MARFFQMLSLKRWCNKTAVDRVLSEQDSYSEFADGHSVPMRMPFLYDEGDPALAWLKTDQGTTFPFRKRYEIANRFVAHIKDLQLVSDFFSMGNQSILFEESYHSEYFCTKVLHAHPEFMEVNLGGKNAVSGPAAPKLLTYMTSGPCRMVDEPCVLIGSRCGQNYWHWITEILPRLWVIDSLPELKAYKIVVPNLSRQFQKESLSALGINQERVLPLPSPLNVMLKEAVWPSLLSPNGYSPLIGQWYARKLGNGQLHNTGKKRIFITRSTATKRAIVNQPDITRILERFGFETHELDGMHFMAQVELFARAEMVIAVNGAALANLLFAGEGTKVIEVLHENILSKLPWMLANAQRQVYTFFMGKGIDNGKDPFNWNIYVDPAEFIRLVETVLKA